MQIQKPGGHKEGRASFPDQFQYKVSKIHQLNSYSRERKREEERKGERATGGRGRRRQPGKTKERRWSVLGTGEKEG